MAGYYGFTLDVRVSVRPSSVRPSVRFSFPDDNLSKHQCNAPDKAQLSLGCTTWVLAALARAQMGTTQTQMCFVLGIWARFGIINFLIFARWGFY